MNKEIQLSRICNNKEINLFEFEFKDVTKGKEATAKVINIQFNTGAFYVLIKELNSIYEGDILLPKFNLTCTKVITAHDKEDNYVHRKIELSGVSYLGIWGPPYLDFCPLSFIDFWLLYYRGRPPAPPFC